MNPNTMTNKQLARMMRELETIKAVVARETKSDPAVLYSRTRNYPMRETRQIAMYVCRKLTLASYPDIALAFGKKNHCTIMHANTVVQDRMALDRKFKARVETLRQSAEQGIASQAKPEALVA